MKKKKDPPIEFQLKMLAVGQKRLVQEFSSMNQNLQYIAESLAKLTVMSSTISNAVYHLGSIASTLHKAHEHLKN